MLSWGVPAPPRRTKGCLGGAPGCPGTSQGVPGMSGCHPGGPGTSQGVPGVSGCCPGGSEGVWVPPWGSQHLPGGSGLSGCCPGGVRMPPWGQEVEAMEHLGVLAGVPWGAGGFKWGFLTFKSLWTMNFWWQYCTADTICRRGGGSGGGPHPGAGHRGVPQPPWGHRVVPKSPCGRHTSVPP